MNRLSKFTVPEIIFGSGARWGAANAIRALDIEHSFVVTDLNMAQSNWLSELKSTLAAQSLPFTVWTHACSPPEDHEITAGARAYTEGRCDGIVALGGGSAMDAAKAIGILASNGGQILDYVGTDMTQQPLPPLVMIPTTIGSAADITGFCVITDTIQNRQWTLIGKNLVPDISLSDPDILLTMPPAGIAASGLNTLSHAVEAYLSVAANSLTDSLALEAINLVNQHLEPFYRDRDDVEARELIAAARVKAGMACANAGLGITHALSLQLCVRLGLHPGLISAVLLPDVLVFNMPAAPARVARISRVLTDAPGSENQLLQAAIRRLRGLSSALGAPASLRDLGVTRELLPEVVDGALRDAWVLANPRRPDTSDLLKFVESLL